MFDCITKRLENCLAIFDQCSKGESDPLLPIVILLTRVGTLVMELPNHLASWINEQVIGERGGNRTHICGFADRCLFQY